MAVYPALFFFHLDAFLGGSIGWPLHNQLAATSVYILSMNVERVTEIDSSRNSFQ